ncbi:hypothetical protein [Salmonirosea aquatica]|uniref:hypothetical protein n=1 Tax=Salmonirosea aquatica TaxID=2654236 RepID=UPI00357101FD
MGVGSGSGVALLIGIILSVSGLLFLALGLFAEIQMRIYYESQRATPYSIRKIHEVATLPKQASPLPQPQYH